jgi:thiol-disulfide isomerase/thioredoxin
MIRIRQSAFLAIFLAPLTAPAGADTEKGKPGPAEEEFLELRKEYLAAIKGVEVDEKKQKISAGFAPRFFALAVKNVKDEAAPDPLMWILINAPQSPEMPKAVRMLENQFLHSPRLKPKLQALHTPAPEIEHFLAAVISKNPDKDTQGIACYALALLLKEQAGDDQPKLRQEAIGLFDRCLTKYGDCPLGNKGPTLAERCRPILFEMRNLVIGKVVPDIAGEDLDGNKFKLSDYRGQVVMLSYWATWCPACMTLAAHERALVKRLEGKPFVLIGVNGDAPEDKKKVKLRMEKDQITWRSFWGGGAIAEKWNVEYWPAIFLIDHNGVIRHRFGVVGPEDLNQAIDPLVAAAKKAAGKKSPAK